MTTIRQGSGTVQGTGATSPTETAGGTTPENVAVQTGEAEGVVTGEAEGTAASDELTAEARARAPELMSVEHLATDDPDAVFPLPRWATRGTLRQGVERIIGRAERYVSDATRQQWRAIGHRYEIVDERMTAENLNRLGSGPAWNGTGMYGQGQAQWQLPDDFELWGFDGAYVDQIMQGYVGDCYLLAAMASIANKDPDLLENMISFDEQTGTYTVRFYDLTVDPATGLAELTEPRQTVEITVDPEMLVLTNQPGQQEVGAQAFDADGDGRVEIGIALIEKAFALYNDQLVARGLTFFGPEEGGARGYDALQGGFIMDAYMALTGEPATYEFGAIKGGPNADDLWDLFSAANGGEAVMVGTIIPANPEYEQAMWDAGIIPGHAYTVLGTVEIDGVRAVALRNPWGKGEPGDPEGDGIFLLTMEDLDAISDHYMFDTDAPSTRVAAQEFTGVADAIQHFVSIANRHGADVGNYGGPSDPTPPPIVDPPPPPPINDDPVPPPPADEPVDGPPDPDLVDIIDPIVDNDVDEAVNRFSGYVTANAGRMHSVDVNALVQWVLRMSYLETTEDLRFYAEKVKYFNAVKKAIRNELTEARDFMAKYGVGLEDEQTLGMSYDKDGNATGGSAQSWPGKGISGDFTGTQTDGQGNPIDPKMDPSLYKGDPISTKASLDSYIKGLEEKLSSVGDDAQLANVDLQNILQKQQQTIQMMSNISKMLHDTAQAIIRKIGG